MLPSLVSVLFTFQIQVVPKIEKIRRQKVKEARRSLRTRSNWLRIGISDRDIKHPKRTLGF